MKTIYKDNDLEIQVSKDMVIFKAGILPPSIAYIKIYFSNLEDWFTIHSDESMKIVQVNDKRIIKELKAGRFSIEYGWNY